MLLISTTTNNPSGTRCLTSSERMELSQALQIDAAHDWQAVHRQLESINQTIVDLARRHKVQDVLLDIDLFWADWLEPFLRVEGLRVFFPATNSDGKRIALPNIQSIRDGNQAPLRTH